MTEIEVTRNMKVSPEVGATLEVKKITPADSDLWMKMGQLRARCYVDEHSYLDSTVLDEHQAEYDEYDLSASHFVVTDVDENVLGTTRLLYRNQDQPDPLLPAEKLFADEIIDPDVSAREISRFIIDKDLLPVAQRGISSMKIGAYLMRAMTHEAIDRHDPVYAVVEPWLMRYLDKVGVPYHVVVQEPRFIDKYNSKNVLVTIDPSSMTRSIHEQDTKRSIPHALIERGMPERLAPFFEKDKATKGLGAIAVDAFSSMPETQWDRNLGWLSKQEQQRLAQSTVAIAGAGGDGGELAITLAQLGVGAFKIADPERFELENLNRQAGASYRTIGRNKAEVIGEMIKDINPFARVEVYNEGVSVDSIHEFVDGADLVIDETEYTQHELGVMIAREARKNGLPVLMGLNVGFGSYVMSFSPAGRSFESCFGLSETASLDEIAATEVDFSRWVSHIPSYGDMNAFSRVANGEVSTPTVASGVKMAAADASTQALAHLLLPISPERKEWITYAPGGRVMDAIDGAKRVKYPKIHFAMSAFRAYARTKLGLNPSAGYEI